MNEQKVAGVGARQRRCDFSFGIALDGEILPGMNYQIKVAAKEAFTKVLRENSLLRHLPERISLISISEGFVEGVVDFDPRVRGLQRFTNLAGLDTGQVAAARRYRHAHKSSHPNGRNWA